LTKHENVNAIEERSKDRNTNTVEKDKGGCYGKKETKIIKSRRKKPSKDAKQKEPHKNKDTEEQGQRHSISGTSGARGRHEEAMRRDHLCLALPRVQIIKRPFILTQSW